MPKSAAPLTITLTMTAELPLSRANGAIGMIAPRANRKNEVIAASQAEPPSSCGSMPSSSRESVSSAVDFVADQFVGEFARCVFGQPFRLVDQLEFFFFLGGDVLQFALLDADLVVVEFARALHRNPLAQRHRSRARHQPGQARDQDRVTGLLRPGDAHNQAEIGEQAVVRAEDGGAQGVPGDGAMATFETGDGAAAHARSAGDGLEQALVRAFFGGHGCGFGVRLRVVAAAVGGFKIS